MAITLNVLQGSGFTLSAESNVCNKTKGNDYSISQQPVSVTKKCAYQSNLNRYLGLHGMNSNEPSRDLPTPNNAKWTGGLKEQAQKEMENSER